MQPCGSINIQSVLNNVETDREWLPELRNWLHFRGWIQHDLNPRIAFLIHSLRV